MSLVRSKPSARWADARRRSTVARFRPWFEDMEERVVPSAGVAGPLHHLAATVAHHHHARHHHIARTGHHAGSNMSGNSAATITTTTPTTSAPVDPPAASADPPASTVVATPVSAAATTTSSTSTTTTTTPVLTLNVSPIDLNLLGLEVRLYGQDASSPVTVTVSAQPGSGELLGNLLNTVGGLLNTQGVSNALNTVLSNVVTLVNQATLSVNGQTSNATPTSTTPVLDAFIAPVHLNLLGAVVDTSPIHLQIVANAGNGLALGNIVTDLANLLNNPTGNLVKDIEGGLTNLLGELNNMFPTIAPAAATTSVSTSTPSTAAKSTAPTSYQVLNLVLPPIDLNLLGLVLQTSTIQVNATAQSGNGELLGNLLFDLFNTMHASQSDLTTINNDLNGVLAKLIGILNTTSLSLPTGAVGSLTSTLQELTSPTFLGSSSGGTVAPQPVLNLSIAQQAGSTTPPVDVNLLGVVVTTSDIQVQLLAQPGDGLILGNLVYNVSHLLDGGALSVLNVLNTLGL